MPIKTPHDEKVLVTAVRQKATHLTKIEAELVLHLAEIERRQLHKALGYETLFAFCVDELGHARDTAYDRVALAAAVIRFPEIADALRSGELPFAVARLIPPTTEQHAPARNKESRRGRLYIVRLLAYAGADTAIEVHGAIERDCLYVVVAVHRGHASIVDYGYRTYGEAKAAWPESS